MRPPPRRDVSRSDAAKPAMLGEKSGTTSPESPMSAPAAGRAAHSVPSHHRCWRVCSCVVCPGVHAFLCGVAAARGRLLWRAVPCAARTPRPALHGDAAHPRSAVPARVSAPCTLRVLSARHRYDFASCSARLRHVPALRHALVPVPFRCVSSHASGTSPRRCLSTSQLTAQVLSRVASTHVPLGSSP